MEGAKYFKLLGISFLVLILSGKAGYSTESYSEKIYKSYISGNISEWKNIVVQLEQKPLNTISSRLELLNYYYGYTGYLISVKDTEQAEKFIAKAEKLIEQILQISPTNATAYAYKGSFIGFKIGLNNLKAVYLGPKSIEYINKSIELDPDNAQGYLEKGNASYYTPSVFGGSKVEAIKFYSKAIGMMEQKKQDKGNWMYFNALTVLAQAYEKNGQMQNADRVYQKILRLEPGFVWVKNELYPNFLKKI